MTEHQIIVARYKRLNDGQFFRRTIMAFIEPLDGPLPSVEQVIDGPEIEVTMLAPSGSTNAWEPCDEVLRHAHPGCQIAGRGNPEALFCD